MGMFWDILGSHLGGYVLAYTRYPGILSIAGLIELPGWVCPGIYQVSQDTKYCRINGATWVLAYTKYTGRLQD